MCLPRDLEHTVAVAARKVTRRHIDLHLGQNQRRPLLPALGCSDRMQLFIEPA